MVHSLLLSAFFFFLSGRTWKPMWRKSTAWKIPYFNSMECNMHDDMKETQFLLSEELGLFMHNWLNSVFKRLAFNSTLNTCSLISSGVMVIICSHKRFDIEWSSGSVKTKRKSLQQEEYMSETTGDGFTKIKAVALNLVYHLCCDSQNRHPSALEKNDCTRFIHFGFSSLMLSEENLSPPCQLNVDTDLCWIKEKRCWRF